jgi:ribosomal protein S27AE
LYEAATDFPVLFSQDCQDLIDPFCTRKCGHEICSECEGNGHEVAEHDDKQRCGDCGHGKCTFCEQSRREPDTFMEEEKRECIECGQIGECIPTKTMEEWEAFYYWDPEVRAERECKAAIRGIRAKLEKLGWKFD